MLFPTSLFASSFLFPCHLLSSFSSLYPPCSVLSCSRLVGSLFLYLNLRLPRFVSSGALGSSCLFLFFVSRVPFLLATLRLSILFPFFLPYSLMIADFFLLSFSLSLFLFSSCMRCSLAYCYSFFAVSLTLFIPGSRTLVAHPVASLISLVIASYLAYPSSLIPYRHTFLSGMLSSIFHFCCAMFSLVLISNVSLSS